MASPRRVVLFLVGLFAAVGGYAVYASYFGMIDGLPPLPEAYTREMPIDPDMPPPQVRVGPTDARLREAFGADCPETDYLIKLEMRAKGLLLAAGEYDIRDGRVVLWPFSLAVYTKERPGRPAEINTLHADKAYLEFDQPVRNIAEIGSRKIVAAELVADPDFPSHDPRVGLIHIANDRGSRDPSDDVLLRTPGPIHYRAEPPPDPKTGQKTPHLWTDNVIEVIDRRNSPRPASPDLLGLPPSRPGDLLDPRAIQEMREGRRPPLPTVTAQVLKIYLAVEPTPPPGAPPPRRKPGTITGVEWVDLGSNVLMNLWVDAQANFLTGSALPPPKKDARPREKGAAPGEKVLVQVETNGPFRYDLATDQARFDIAPRSDPLLPNHVVVTRHAGPTERDMLACDALEIQFRRGKNPEPGAGPMGEKEDEKEDGEQNEETAVRIERVHAWGKHLALSSDAEQMQAWGNELVYDATKKVTVLTGEKMTAIMEGNLIEARQLTLSGIDRKKPQQAIVQGPGRIGLAPLDPKTRAHTREATWRDVLVFGREKGPRGELEVLTFTGGAVFRDSAARRELTAREIRLWLTSEPVEGTTPPGKPGPGGPGERGTGRRRPYRLRAEGAVVVHSPDLEVRRTDLLTVHFKDVPPPKAPAKGAPPKGPAKGAPPPKAPVPRPKGEDRGPKNGPAEAPPPAGPPAPDAPGRPPLEVEAHRIEAWVRRSGPKNELERVVCDGRVAVHQDPTEDQPKGVDVSGERMVLDHFPDGDELTVTGSPKNYARVVTEKLSLLGTDVRVDQRANTATVVGAGSMDLLSEAGLQGEKLKDPVPVHIVWADRMEFYGTLKCATFKGKVQATQLQGRVLCETMHVTFDREVYLNPGNRPPAPDGRRKESPRIEDILCDQQPADGGGDGQAPPRPVLVEDEKREGGKLVSFQRVEAPTLKLDNPQKLLFAFGPGEVRVLERGAKDPLGKEPKERAGSPPEEEMKLTWVRFRGRMDARKDTNSATFWDTVEVLHVPSEDRNLKPDPTRLPEGGLYLQCSRRLDVYTEQGPGGAKTHGMRADGNAFIRARDFYGRADEIKYDEEKDTVTFVGSPNSPARLYRVLAQGQPPEPVAAVKITYFRRTGTYKGEGLINVSGGSR